MPLDKLPDDSIWDYGSYSFVKQESLCGKENRDVVWKIMMWHKEIVISNEENRNIT